VLALPGGFAYRALVDRQLVPVGPLGVGEPVGHGRSQAREHGTQAAERGVCAPAEDDGQDPATGRFLAPPEPARAGLSAHK
jgi:hypothetical protein